VNPIQRAWHSALASLKKLSSMAFPQATYQWWSGGYGRSRLDYQSAVGDGRGSAIVVACIRWLTRAFLEAPLRVRRYDGDDLVPEPRHPLLALVRRPNPYYAGRALWKATLADRLVTGNAYWIKVRSQAGRVVELWWAPSWTMEPKWDEDGRTYISHYEYNVSRGDPIRLDPSEVVHFRDLLDPHNPRKGISPLATLMREIFTDDEASTFTAALLTNLGVPGTIISAGDSDTEITQDQATQMKAEFEHKFSGDNRGRAMVLGGNVKVNTVTFTPEQMQLTQLRRLPEERVAAVLGTPAVLVGLGAGMDKMIYNNYSEAREAAFEEHLIPLGQDLAEELMLQLVPDFEDVTKVELDFDTSTIRVLQEDQNALATRLEVMLRSGQVTLAEARQRWAMPPLADVLAERGSAEPDPGDVLLLPSSIKPMPIEDLLLPPAPPPTIAPLVPVVPPEADEGDAEEEVPPTKRRRLTGRKAFSQPDQWFTRAADDVASLTDDATPPLERLFARTGRAVLAGLPASLPVKALVLAGHSNGRKADEPVPPDLANLVPGSHERDLTRTLRDTHEAAIAKAADSVADGLGISFQLPFEVTDDVLDGLATRIRDIADGTRDDVRRIVRHALDRGATIDDLRDDLRGLFTETYRNRSRTIARTESGTAYNAGTIASYRESGIVTGVLVHDGEDDEPCRSANGSTWTLEQAQAEPLGHPNCVRAFSPVVGE